LLFKLNSKKNRFIEYFVNKELEIKIIDYLRKLEKGEISPAINGKKKSMLLA